MSESQNISELNKFAIVMLKHAFTVELNNIVIAMSDIRTSLIPALERLDMEFNEEDISLLNEIIFKASLEILNNE